LTEKDLRDYQASGRSEPNLHIFTNEMHHPHDSRLDKALEVSWEAFLAAAESTDPGLWAAAHRAGTSLLEAYAEAGSNDDSSNGNDLTKGTRQVLCAVPLHWQKR
jgi:hypothetical protein